MIRKSVKRFSEKIMPKTKTLEEPGDPAPIDAVTPGEVGKIDRERLPISIAIVPTSPAPMTARRRLGVGLRLHACIGLGGGIVGLRHNRGPGDVCGRGLSGSGGGRRRTRCRCWCGVF